MLTLFYCLSTFLSFVGKRYRITNGFTISKGSRKLMVIGILKTSGLQIQTIVIILLLIFSNTINAQTSIQEFRSFEKRVRYAFPDSLILFAQSLDTSNINDKIYFFLAHGKYDFHNSRFDKSYVNLSKAKSFALKNNNIALSAEISLDITNCLSTLDNTGKSLESLLYAKNIFDTIGNKEQNGRLHIAMGELYRKIGEYEKANAALEKSKQYIIGNPTLEASYFNRKAAIQSETGNIDSAYFFSMKALEASRLSEDISLAAISENELGYIFKHQNKEDSAIIHFIRADSIFRKCGMTAYAIQATIHHAALLGVRREDRKVVAMLTKEFEIAVINNWYRLIRDISEHLRNSYIILKNKDSVNYYQGQMQQAQINLLEQQYKMNTRLVESVFEENNYMEEIEQKEQLLKEERLERDRTESEKKFMVVVITLIILALVLSIYVIFIQVNRRRKIFQDKLEKERQNKELEMLLKNNEALVHEISHRVKNNLSVLSGLLGIQKIRSTNPELKKELNKTILRIESISAIHNQLYDSKEVAMISLEKPFRELSENICLTMGYTPERQLELELNNIVLDIARSVNLSMILNELLTNSFKYAVKSEGNKIGVNLKKADGSIVLTVRDEGNGMKTEGIELKPKASGSMGLYLIDILCRQLNAKKETMKDKDYFYVCISFKL